MTTGSSKPKSLYIVASSSQAKMFDAIRRELWDWNSLAVTTDWHNKEARNILESSNFPYKAIETYVRGKPKDILDQEDPSIVIVGHDILPASQLFIKAANLKGIPTLLVQDGILAADRDTSNNRAIYSRLNFLVTLPLRLSRFLELLRHRKFTPLQILRILRLELTYNPKGKIISTYGHGECSRIAVFGDAVKEMLVSEGVDPGRIVITGNPKFDELYYSKRVSSKESVCKRWEIPQGNEIIVLVCQFFVGIKAPKQARKFLVAIINAVMTFQNVTLIIKVHPGEDEDIYQEIVEGLGYPAVISKDSNIVELLSSASLVLTVSSTVALEAMAIGRPVVIVNLFNDPTTLFYRESGALFAYTKKDISQAITRVLNNPQTREGMRTAMERFVYKHAYLQDGKASKRIAQLIISMAAKRLS